MIDNKSDNARGSLQVGPDGRQIAKLSIFTIALTPAIVATITTAEQTFAVPAVEGLAVGDVVLVQKPTSQAGLGICGARVSAANTLAITWVNPTAGGLTPTAGEVYTVVQIRG